MRLVRREAYLTLSLAQAAKTREVAAAKQINITKNLLIIGEQKVGEARG